MAQYVKQGNIFGRIGSGIGQGLAEQVPKEIERTRLQSGLEELNNNKNLSPQDYFTKALSIPGLIDRPQVVQSLENLSRQRAIINSAQQQQQNVKNQLKNIPQQDQGKKPIENEYTSSTTKQGVKSTLNPYIPPSGQEIENQARQLVANEPLIYPNLESARAAINNKISANVNKSNAEINKRNLEQGVQSKTEEELSKELGKIGAQIPGNFLSRLEKKAIEDVRTGKLTESEAGKTYGEKADKISRDFAKIRGWGGLDLITNQTADLFSAIRSIREKYPDRKDRIDIANEMIGENGLSPNFAYATMNPVKEVVDLNKTLKSLPNISPKPTKVMGQPGLAGLGYGRPSGVNAQEKTLEIAPKLLKEMGKQGSPLSVAYELEKLGYDPQVWKDYLLDHKGELTGDQFDELGSTQKSFSGWLNDWWFKSFTGIK